MLDEYGGITCLTENIIKQIAQTKQRWSFTLLLRKENRVLSELLQLKNVKAIKVSDAFGYAKDLIFNLLNVPTFGLARDKLMQLVYYGNIFLNDNPDVFWDPVGGRTVNNFSIPKITTIHDTLEIDQSEFFKRKLVNQIKERNFQGLKNSYKIITVSEFTKKRIIDVYGIKNDKICVIPIRLAKRVQRPLGKIETRRILDKYKLSLHNYFIFVSQYYPHKNHRRLIQAFADLIKNNQDYNTIKLVITGNMSDAHGVIEQFAAQQPCKNNIIFTGRIDTAELSVLLSNALCFVHPSLYEGFGMPIIEAMASGIPVVCSNVSSLPEVAGDAALYFNPYDVGDIERALLEVVQSQEVRENLIKKGYSRAKKFEDSRAMIEAYINIFEEAR
ncbi:MAG: glycosyltransferase family 4 protein [Alphaproteobacteria bacterium]|nr:glycosyltransferase family 4 protein [Alphaproteobacteria bacterium]